MELIQGLGGDDTTSGGDTDDKLEGGDGDDALTGGRRQRHPHRRAGADRFVATAGSGDDVVTDFTVGSDLIDVAAFGGYQSIVQDGADTLVTVASGVTLRLTGVTATAVTEASFLGLPPPPPPLPPPAS